VTISKIRFSPGNSGATSTSRFNIIWKGNTKSWQTYCRKGSSPISVNLAAMSEIINRDDGRAFFLPSLSKACGFEAIGLRKIILNSPIFRSYEEATINDPELEAAIAEEMVKILTLYFDPLTGEAIRKWGVNNGDFVYKALPDGAFSLKLVSARSLEPYPILNENSPHFNAMGFIDNLIRTREWSITHQNPDDPQSNQLALFPFTPTDICRGIKKALVEKHGAKAARPMLLKWLGAYITGNTLAAQIKELPPEEKVLVFRSIMAREEIGRFLFEEEKYPRGVIEL